MTPEAYDPPGGETSMIDWVPPLSVVGVLYNGIIFFNLSSPHGELSFLSNTIAIYKNMIEGGLNITITSDVNLRPAIIEGSCRYVTAMYQINIIASYPFQYACLDIVQ